MSKALIKVPAQVRHQSHNLRENDSQARAKRVEKILRLGVIGFVVLLIGFVFFKESSWITDTRFSNEEGTSPQNTISSKTIGRRSVKEPLSIDAARARQFGSRGYELAHEQSFDEALIQYKEAIRLDPVNAEYQFCTAEILRSQSKPLEAIGFLEKAIELEPDNFVYKVKWPLLQIEAGNGPEIAQRINSLSQERSLPMSWGFAKAALLLRLQKTADAKATLQVMKENLPNDVYQSCVRDRVLKRYEKHLDI